MKPPSLYLHMMGFLSFCISCSSQSNTLRKFKVPSGANEPSIKEGSYIYVSNLIKPKRFDFICFKTKAPEMGEYTAVFRLCGLEGDVIEIKNRDLYVNGTFVDDSLTLMNQYAISNSTFQKFVDSIDMNAAYPNETKDSIYVILNSAFIRRNKINSKRVVLDKNHEDNDIQKAFLQSWNQDNFGPVIVPPDSYFVLGDNRHMAMDSRYIGFISKDSLVATVFYKK